MERRYKEIALLSALVVSASVDVTASRFSAATAINGRLASRDELRRAAIGRVPTPATDSVAPMQVSQPTAALTADPFAWTIGHVSPDDMRHAGAPEAAQAFMAGRFPEHVLKMASVPLIEDIYEVCLEAQHRTGRNLGPNFGAGRQLAIGHDISLGTLMGPNGGQSLFNFVLAFVDMYYPLTEAATSGDPIFVRVLERYMREGELALQDFLFRRDVSLAALAANRGQAVAFITAAVNNLLKGFRVNNYNDACEAGNRDAAYDVATPPVHGPVFQVSPI